MWQISSPSEKMPSCKCFHYVMKNKIMCYVQVRSKSNDLKIRIIKILGGNKSIEHEQDKIYMPFIIFLSKVGCILVPLIHAHIVDVVISMYNPTRIEEITRATHNRFEMFVTNSNHNVRSLLQPTKIGFLKNRKYHNETNKQDVLMLLNTITSKDL